MALKATMNTMKKLLAEIECELEGVEKGNKAAGKRGRKATLQFAKVAKLFRKESVAAGKSGKKRKKR
jgi:hypothetical protein